MAQTAPTFTEKDRPHWKLLTDFRGCLQPLLDSFPLHASWAGPRRRLLAADYLSLFLFTLVNPVVTTLRGLCAATQLARVQAEVATRPVSLGSFSEAHHLLDPALLEPLLASLSAQVQGPPPTDPRAAWQDWFARDSSRFAALPRMAWAQYGGGRAGSPNHAGRLHVSVPLWDDQPACVQVTAGRVCERKRLRPPLAPGATDVGDRSFAADQQLFADLEKHGGRLLLRLRDAAVVTVEAALPLSDADRTARLTSAAWARLGHRARARTARLRGLPLQGPPGPRRLVTNIPPAELSAAEAGAMYRRRWQIEGFFRWLKCVLGGRHWLAESERGVTLQLDLALIAGLRLHLVLGRRPHKRLMERLHFYLLGGATAEERAAATAAALNGGRKQILSERAGRG